MKRIESDFVSPPILPTNGTEAIKLLRQNKWIEVKNELVFWFIEEMEKTTNFSFCYQINKNNNNWTTLNMLE